MHQTGTDSGALSLWEDADRPDTKSRGRIDMRTGGYDVPDDLVIVDSN